MSNVIPAPITNLLEVSDSVLSFSYPAIVVHKPSNLKAINVNQTNTFSNSAISVKLDLPNAETALEKNILWRQKFSVKVSGNSNDANRPIYEVGSFAPRSNPLSKIVNTCNVVLGASSYSMTLGSTVDMLERFNSNSPHKYQSQLSPAMLDTSTTNDDFQGSARNPLGPYNATSGDDVLPRGTYTPYSITKNSNTEFHFEIMLEDYLPVAPLLSNIMRGGGSYALTHLTALNIDLTFFAGALGQRLFSFARNRSNGNVLNITNIEVQLLQPEFRFITMQTNYDIIPNLVYYPLRTIERQPQNYIMPYGVAQTINSPVITLARIPSAVIFALKPSQNAVQYNNQTTNIDGSQLSDSFTRCDNVQILFDGQALLTNSKNCDLYKMSSENGLVDNYQIFSGVPLVNGMNAVDENGNYLPTYFSPSGSCVKLMFGKDVSLRRGLAPMVSYRTQFQINATFTNYNRNVENFEFSVVMVYDNVLALFDTNLSAISYSPLSEADAMNAHKENISVHPDMLRSNQLNGAGFMGDVFQKLITSAKTLYPHVKSFYDSETGKVVRNTVKEALKSRGHSGIADALHSIGFGEGAISAGASSGGSGASKSKLRHNLL